MEEKKYRRKVLEEKCKYRHKKEPTKRESLEGKRNTEESTGRKMHGGTRRKIDSGEVLAGKNRRRY